MFDLDTLARIDAVVDLYGRGSPATTDQIADVEAAIGRPLDAAYAQLIGRHGGCYVGIDVHGIVNARGVGRETVTELTAGFRAAGWPELEDAIVFADDGAGNPCYLAADGTVRLLYHDNGDVVILGDSFVDFVRGILPDPDQNWNRW
jgi:hypothetical protein